MADGNDVMRERMLTAPMAPLIVRLAIPTTLSMLVTSVYNLADTAFVGRLGTSASGAVGIVFGFMAIIQALGFMFGQGAGSKVARALGANDHETADTYASCGLALALGTGVLVCVLTLVFLGPLVRVLGSTETIAPYAATYISYIACAAPFMMGSFHLNLVLRYEGKPALGMLAMFAGALTNIACDVLFIFGLGMGIAGAGLATALSETLSFAILITLFVRGRSTSHLSVRRARPDLPTVTEICATGFPSLLRQGLASYTTMLLNQQSAPYGDAAIAAMSIVSRITFLVFSVAIGVGQGFQPVSAYNFGAGRYDRVRAAYRTTLAISQALMAVFVLLLCIWPAEVVRVFRDDPAVVEIGARTLTIQALGLLAVPISMVTEMLYQSCGQKAGASIISALRGGVLFIPVLLVLARLRGLSGIEEAQAVDYVLVVPIALVFARRFFARFGAPDTSDPA